MSGCSRKIGSKCSNCLQNIYVEPVALLAFIALNLFATIQPSAMEQKMEKIYNVSEPSAQLLSKLDHEDFIQTKIVHWNMLITAINFPIAMVSSIVWSALSDNHGRQQPMLLGLCSLTWSVFGWFLVLTDAINVSMYWKIPATFLTAAWGENTLQYMASQAFLADTVTDKKILTIRMNVVSIIRGSGSFIGASLAGWLSEIYSFSKLAALTQFLILIAFFYVLWRIPQIPPKQIADAQEMAAMGYCPSDYLPLAPLPEPGENITVLPKQKITMKSLMEENLKLFVDTWDAFAKPRKGHLRFIIIAIAIIQFVSTMSTVEAAVLIGVYTLRSPFEWQPKDLAWFNNIATVFGLIGQIAGIVLFKNVLNLRDTSVVIIGLLSMTLSTIPIAFATNMWTMQIANILGMFSNLLSPTLSSFIASLVSVDELGKIYTAFSMTQFVGQMLQQFVLQEIYLWTLNFFPGFMWLFISFLSFICVIVMLAIHVISKRENIGESEPILHRDYSDAE